MNAKNPHLGPGDLDIGPYHDTMSGTNLGKMPILIVSLVIGIVMATTAIVPLVSDYSEAKTFTNEGYYTMDLTDSSTTKTIAWDPSDPSILTIDNVDFDMSAFSEVNKSYTIIGSDTLIVRYSVTTTRTLIQAYGSDSSYAVYQTSDTLTYVNISISGGNVTFTSDKSGMESVTFSIGTECFSISIDGDYSVMKKSNVPAYVLEDSEIRLIGISYGTSKNSSIGIYGTGTIEDGITVSTLYLGSDFTTVTYTDPVATKAAVDGYTSLYTLDKYTFTANIDGTDTEFTYSYFIVPHEVTSDPDNPEAYKALVRVVPVMAFVALIAAAAYMIYSKRD